MTRIFRVRVLTISESKLQLVNPLPCTAMMTLRRRRHSHITMVKVMILSALIFMMMTCWRLHWLTHHFCQKNTLTLTLNLISFISCHATVPSLTHLKTWCDHTSDVEIQTVFGTAFGGNIATFEHVIMPFGGHHWKLHFQLMDPTVALLDNQTKELHKYTHE